MKAKFSNVDPASGFEPLPAGVYPCICVGYREEEKNGDGYIHLEWQVETASAYSGRKVWDQLCFKPGGAIGRAKLVCQRLGLKKDLNADIDLEQNDFVGVRATLTVVPNEYVAGDGTKKKNNKVTFSGYNEPAPGGNGAAGQGRIENPIKSALHDADAPPF